ncbi:MAG TPA: trypsin-like peptidase domain-containing protein [Vicinamibacterales bacterium]|nr:trypsin-like peptidase domain-containing protein [Vicinamibacterales bacterium]
MSLVQKSFVALALAAGFVGGLVVSGRLALTSPSMAEAPAPLAAPAAAPAAQTATRGAALATLAPGANLSDIAEAALRASANISSTTIVEMDPFMQFWSGNRVQQSQSVGSGVVVSPDGYVLTNKHVIGNAGADIRVTLPGDSKERPARLIGIDEVSDLAVVKVSAPTKLETLPWGESSKLRVAEIVLAIGNPFQLSGTVTMGIVSSVKRTGAEVGSYQDFIQTDAAINPGNSGGALVNTRGELVGINTMIYSETGGYQGIGFAIPSDVARRIMTELIEHGTVTWGSIGDIVWFTIDQNIAARNDLDVTGAYVRSISSASPAYRAGLEPGDIVTTLNGQRITDADQIDRVVVRQKVGSTIKLGVRKRNGRTVTIDVPIVARQSQTFRRRT